MKKTKTKVRLKRERFDQAIARHIDYLVSLGYFDNKQRHLKFFPDKIQQRNPRQVPQKIWTDLVKQYLFRINEN